jgi:hypothetical protein
MCFTITVFSCPEINISEKISASNINKFLFRDNPFSRKLTFHVWASRGHTVMFLKIPPVQRLFREMVFIND